MTFFSFICQQKDHQEEIEHWSIEARGIVGVSLLFPSAISLSSSNEMTTTIQIDLNWSNWGDISFYFEWINGSIELINTFVVSFDFVTLNWKCSKRYFSFDSSNKFGKKKELVLMLIDEETKEKSFLIRLKNLLISRVSSR